MKILSDFRLNYGEIYKSIFGKALSAGEAAASAAAASGPAAPSVSSPGGGSSTSSPGAGAEGRKRGGKYVSREWVGGKWQYEYADDLNKPHRSQLDHSDQDASKHYEHTMEVPESHQTGEHSPEEAYAAAHVAHRGKTFPIPHPNPDVGGELTAKVGHAGDISLHDATGQAVQKFANHGYFEQWARKQASRPVTIMGPTGKPMMEVYKNTGTVDAKTGTINPVEKDAPNAWMARFIKPSEGADPDFYRAPKEISTSAPNADPNRRLANIRSPHEAGLFNQLHELMAKHEAAGRPYTDRTQFDQVHARSREGGGVAEVAARELKGKHKNRHDRAAINSMMADSADPILRQLANQHSIVNGRQKFIGSPEAKAKLIKDVAARIAPDVQRAARGMIGKFKGNEDLLAQELGFGSYDMLSSTDPRAIAAAVVGASDPRTSLGKMMENAVDNYDPTVQPIRWKEGDPVAPAPFAQFAKQQYTKELGGWLDNAAEHLGIAAAVAGDTHKEGGTKRAIYAGDPSSVMSGQGHGPRTDQGGAMHDMTEYQPHSRKTGVEGVAPGGQRTLADVGHAASTPEQDLAQRKVAERYAKLRGETVDTTGKFDTSGGMGTAAPDIDTWQKMQLQRLDHFAAQTTDPTTLSQIPQMRKFIQGTVIENPERLDAISNTFEKWGSPDHFVRLGKALPPPLLLLQKAIIAIRSELRKAQPQFLTQDKKVDPSHTYSHREGDEDHPTFFFRDTLGNYWRYTNAPTGHPDNSSRLGDATLHASEPTPAKAAKFFDLRGRKLNRAPFTGAPVQWNPSYHSQDNANLWAGRWVNPNSGEHEYAYLDADMHDNPMMHDHQQLVTTDMRLPVLRMRVRELMSSPHIKDNVTAAALALVDQGHFSAEEMATLSVGDVEDYGTLYKIGGRFIYPDHKMRTMLVALTKNRHRDEPLFSVPFVKNDGEVDYSLSRRMGIHYLMCTIDQIGLTFEGITKYHATQAFSRELQRMVIQDRVPWETAIEYATLSVAQEMGLDVLLEGASASALPLFRKILIDPIALAIMERNAKQYAIGGNAMPMLPLPPPPVLYISLDLTSRTVDEDAFSKWLHTFPAHMALTQGTLPNPANSSNMLEAVA